MSNFQSNKKGFRGAPSRKFGQQSPNSNVQASGNRARNSSRAEGKMASLRGQSSGEGVIDGWLIGGGDDEWDSIAVSHEALKNNKWFKGFFEQFDGLTLKVIDETQWQCPACQGGGAKGAGSFKGVRPLLDHAKHVTSARVTWHRALGHVLEEELKRRMAACLLARGVFGKWMGLQGGSENPDIVWPPMVIVRNTHTESPDNHRWQGMANNELLESFKGYKAVKAKQAYGPNGHRGMSLLIFEDSARGYLEADRLHKHFLKEGRGKNDWYNRRSRVLSLPSGKRVLYGYFATEEEMEIFNKHLQERSKVKYDMKPYQVMVVEPMKKINEDNEKLAWLQTKVAEDRERTKTLEEIASTMAQKLKMKENETKVMIQKYTERVHDCAKEIDYMERTYKQEIEQLIQDISKRDQELEKMQKEFKSHEI